MTTKQAINLLERISYSQHDAEKREALSMAVRALEGDGDMISRQAVMKEFSDFVRESNNSDFAPTPTWNDAVSLVGSMPSVQPVNYGSTKSDSSSQLKLNNDLISRQALCEYALNQKDKSVTPNDIMRFPSAQQQRILYANMSDAEFEKWLYEHGICNPNIHESIPCDAVPLLIDNAISELPSAQHKKGKWIEHNPHKWGLGIIFECSECGYEMDCEEPNYCPSCGADMRGESDE